MEQKKNTLVEWLPDFFRHWPKNGFQADGAEKHCLNIDPDRLADFFSRLSGPLELVQHRSLVFDPWDIAGLKRKEVRHTAVLAWLLDPYESHGFKRLPMHVLLQSIRKIGRTDIPENFHRHCQVQVETTPRGDNANRIDIEIDADNFYLLIEVKIDACEQENQISRYCLDARQRAGQRPWAVVFLTPHGGKPLTIGTEFSAKDVPCLAWRHLARDLESALQSEYRHIVVAENPSPMRQMAAHATFCFIKRMRKF